MGARIPEASERPPNKFHVTRCPTCGHKRVTVDGAWLRYQRLKKGLSQREAGRQLGVSSPYLSDLETNRRDCPPSIEEAYPKLRRGR